MIKATPHITYNVNYMFKNLYPSHHFKGNKHVSIMCPTCFHHVTNIYASTHRHKSYANMHVQYLHQLYNSKYSDRQADNVRKVSRNICLLMFSSFREDILQIRKTPSNLFIVSINKDVNINPSCLLLA